MPVTIVDRVIELFLGSKHEREMKRLTPRVAAINAREPQVAALSDEELRERIVAIRAEIRAATAELPDGVRRAAQAGAGGARRTPRGGVRDRPRGRQAGARDAPLRRPAHRRHGAARRQDLRDADRRGQDAGRDARARPQRPHRARRPPRHRQRLPRQARRRLDGTALHVPRPHRRLHPEPDGRPGAARRLPGRHHLRHQQRVRLRLPARQHEVRRRQHGAARAHLRHRRRGRLDPGRRGAHPADHLRPLRGLGRPVLPGRPHHPQAGQGRGDPRQVRQQVDDRRLHRRREGARRRAHRGGRGQGREAALLPQPVRPEQHRDAARGPAGAARPRALPARPRLHRQGRRR